MQYWCEYKKIWGGHMWSVLIRFQYAKTMWKSFFASIVASSDIALGWSLPFTQVSFPTLPEETGAFQHSKKLCANKFFNVLRFHWHVISQNNVSNFKLTYVVIRHHSFD